VVRQCIPKLRIHCIGAAALKAAAAEEEVTVQYLNKFADRERRLREGNLLLSAVFTSFCNYHDECERINQFANCASRPLLRPGDKSPGRRAQIKTPGFDLYHRLPRTGSESRPSKWHSIPLIN